MLRKISHKQPIQLKIPTNPLKNYHQIFKPGEIFKGVVTQKLQGREVMISGKGKQFSAFTNLNLKEGSTNHFQVRKIGLRTELKVMGGLTDRLESPVQIWASNRAARKNLEDILKGLARAESPPGISRASQRSLTDLKQFFPALLFNYKNKNPSQWLSRYLKGNGIFWENKIARFLQGGIEQPLEKLMRSDLKGILMNIMKNLGVEDQNQDQIRTILSNLRQAIFLIEQDQFLNLSSIKEGYGWFWFIPGDTEGGFQGAELFVKEEGEDEELAVSMFLEFTILGRIHTEISINNTSTCVRIGVEDKDKADLITENLPILEKNLKDLGIKTGTIICDVKEFQGRDCLPFSDGESLSPAVHIVI